MKEENKLQIFKNEEFGEIKKIKTDNEYMGYFYILEYGNLIKIGSTQKLYERLMALKRNAEKYGNLKLGRFAVSIAHTNYFENEKKLHNMFKNFRKERTELFNLKFNDVINKIKKTDIEYLDETLEKNIKVDNFLKGMKKFIFGGGF